MSVKYHQWIQRNLQILPDIDLDSHYTSKMELSVKKFNRFNNSIIIAQVLQTY